MSFTRIESTDDIYDEKVQQVNNQSSTSINESMHDDNNEKV